MVVFVTLRNDIKQTLFNFTIDCSQLIDSTFGISWIYCMYVLVGWLFEEQICVWRFSLCSLPLSLWCSHFCVEKRKKNIKMKNNSILNYINYIAINWAFSVHELYDIEWHTQLPSGMKCDNINMHSWAQTHTNLHISSMCATREKWNTLTHNADN